MVSTSRLLFDIFLLLGKLSIRNLQTFLFKAASSPKIHASYSAILSVHSNYNMIAIGYCSFDGKIRIALKPL